MYCRSCRYGLEGLDAGRCPECGVPFDPTDPSTYAEWRYKPQALIGIAAAIGIHRFSEGEPVGVQIVVVAAGIGPLPGHQQEGNPPASVFGLQ